MSASGVAITRLLGTEKVCWLVLAGDREVGVEGVAVPDSVGVVDAWRPFGRGGRKND